MAIMDYFRCQMIAIENHINQYEHHLAERTVPEYQEILALKQELIAFVNKLRHRNIPAFIFHSKYTYDLIETVVTRWIAKCWDMSNEMIDLMIDGFRAIRPPPVRADTESNTSSSLEEISASE